MKVRRVSVQIVMPDEGCEADSLERLNEFLAAAWDRYVLDWRYPEPASDVVEVEGEHPAEYEEYSAFDKVLDTD